VAGKPVAIMSATGGRAGGERTQFSLRLCMMPFRANVLPGPEVLVGQASANSSTMSGRLTNERNLAALEELMGDLRAEAGLGQARLGAELRRDAVRCFPRRDRPSSPPPAGPCRSRS
jgi:NAD(P)H-dependent FMN reductase